MSYLGNSPTQQGFIPAVDFFSGNGITTAFTLSRPVASVAQVQATIENVPQNPGTAFTVSGNTITFDGAPPSGTNNIYVYYTSPITQVIQPGAGTVGLSQLSASGSPSSSTFLRGDNSWQVVPATPTAVSDQLNASTGYFDLPTGTTAQRPGSPVVGMIRMNTTTGNPEWYSTAFGSWVNFADLAGLTVTVFAWGGGGAGGWSAGSGGGGGAATGTFNALGTTSYAVVVGGGGSSQAPNAGAGSAVPGGGGLAGNLGFGGQGGGYTGIFLNASSQSNAYLIAGGGGGAAFEGSAGGAGGGTNGVAGGSGAEAGGGGGTQSAGGTSVSQTGSALQGGSAGSQSDGGGSGGGGGGYWGGGAGANSNPGSAGGGGSGYFNPSFVTGATLTAGSGTTPGDSSNPLRGGAGGGGTNTGSGTVGRLVIRYSGTTTRATGGTITNDGTFTYHTFTSAGTFTVTGA